VDVSVCVIVSGPRGHRCLCFVTRFGAVCPLADLGSTARAATSRAVDDLPAASLGGCSVHSIDQSPIQSNPIQSKQIKHTHTHKQTNKTKNTQVAQRCWDAFCNIGRFLALGLVAGGILLGVLLGKDVRTAQLSPLLFLFLWLSSLDVCAYICIMCVCICVYIDMYMSLCMHPARCSSK
jgi:hypothetical protein